LADVLDDEVHYNWKIHFIIGILTFFCLATCLAMS